MGAQHRAVAVTGGQQVDQAVHVAVGAELVDRFQVEVQRGRERQQRCRQRSDGLVNSRSTRRSARVSGSPSASDHPRTLSGRPASGPLQWRLLPAWAWRTRGRMVATLPRDGSGVHQSSTLLMGASPRRDRAAAVGDHHEPTWRLERLWGSPTRPACTTVHDG
jgi:hypothetical protein